MAIPSNYDKYSSALGVFSGPSSPAAAAAKTAAPSILSSIPGWVNPALAGASLLGGGIASYLQAQDNEEALAQRKREFEEQKRRARVEEQFRERDWQDGNVVRGAAAANQVYPALNQAADWRARIAALSRGAA